MPFVQLVPDGGDVSLVLPVATHVYGSRTVALPDGVQERKTEGQTNGYTYEIPGARAGRSEIAWVRADAHINAAPGPGQGWSDQEQVLDAAAKRTRGEVFFQRDIEGAGLGRFKPGADFTVGDIVGVQVWGKSLPLPVTSVERTATTAGFTHRVHVGGEPISDGETLAQHNADILAKIDAERRQAEKARQQQQQQLDLQKQVQDQQAALQALQDERIGSNETKITSITRDLSSPAGRSKYSAISELSAGLSQRQRQIEKMRTDIDKTQDSAIAANRAAIRVGERAREEIVRTAPEIGYYDHRTETSGKFGVIYTTNRAVKVLFNKGWRGRIIAYGRIAALASYSAGGYAESDGSGVTQVIFESSDGTPQQGIFIAQVEPSNQWT